jgi:hypothetical protein
MDPSWYEENRSGDGWALIIALAAVLGIAAVFNWIFY